MMAEFLLPVGVFIMDGLASRFTRLLSVSLFFICVSSANAQSYKSMIDMPPASPVDSAEIGIMGGFNTSHATGNITGSGPSFGSASVFRGSSDTTRGEVGLQFREIFNVNSTVEPYIYVNAVSLSGDTSSMNMGPLIAGAQSSTLVSNDNWVARLGVGFQAPMGLHHLVGGLGVGVSVLGQALTENINEPGAVTSSFRSYSKIFQPTFMGNLNWQFCQTCMAGFPGSLAAQASFESFHKVNLRGTTPSGNLYVGTLNQHWDVHGDLILSVRLPT